MIEPSPSFISARLTELSGASKRSTSSNPNARASRSSAPGTPRSSSASADPTSRAPYSSECKDCDVVIFRDDDSEFHDWLDRHPEAYFIKAGRRPTIDSLVIHGSRCPHFDRSGGVKWTYTLKACATDRSELEKWARDETGGEPTNCRDCERMGYV